MGHSSRDSTAMEARENPVPKKKALAPAPKQRKCPKKGETRSKELRRMEKQRTMEVDQMLKDLPKDGTVGCKRNAKGHTTKWIGYKLHMDTADDGVPIRCMITSASMYDRQAALPRSRITEQRGTYLYEIMDRAYDAEALYAESRAPIIDKNPRNQKAAHDQELKAQRHANFIPAERQRYKERSTVERAFGRVKEEFGARNLRVRGHEKVMCHLMFGVVVLTVDQMLRWIQ